MSLTGICRLCCSCKDVNNDIFCEKKALHLKMNYLPIKVSKDDELPHKICDQCYYKVLDFHTFCILVIEAQTSLQSTIQLEGSRKTQFTEHDASDEDTSIDGTTIKDEPEVHLSSVLQIDDIKSECDPLDRSQPKQCNVNQSESSQLQINTNKANSQKIQVQSSYPQEDEPLRVVHNNAMSGTKTRVKKTKQVKNTDKNGEENQNKTFSKKNKTMHISLQENSHQALQSSYQHMKCIATNIEDDPTILVENFERDRTKKQIEESVVTPSQQDPEGNHSETSEEEGATHECCICLARLANKKQLLQHYSEHQNLPKLPSEPYVPPFPEEEPATCSKCGESQTRHSWNIHWIEHWAKDSKPKRLRCRSCQASFISVTAILKHGLKHEDGVDAIRNENPKPMSVACDLCQCQFVKISGFLQHRRRVHVDSENVLFKCARCLKVCSTQRLLVLHLARHEGVYRCKCTKCGKVLANNYGLKVHMRRHDGVKPYVCKTCGKGFVNSTSLVSHIRVHTGERPFVCPECNKSFNQKSPLVVHMRSHSASRPYVCEKCGRGYVSRGLLTMHLKAPCSQRAPTRKRKRTRTMSTDSEDSE